MVKEKVAMFRLKVLALLAIMSVFAAGCVPQESSTVQAKSLPSKAKAAPEPKAAAKAAPAPTTDKKPAVVDTKPAPGATVVKTWDFTQLNLDAWADFYFPGNAKAKAKDGAVFTQFESVVGPQILKFTWDASQVGAVRVELMAQRTKDKDGKSQTPVKLTGVDALWVGPDDIKGKTAKYAETRSAKMTQRNPANPNEWTASLSTEPAWKGKVARLAFRLNVPDQLKVGGDDRYFMAIKKIELLK